jgi:hypothetical protein
MQDNDDAREQKVSDAEMIKIWIEAGIPTVIPGPVFRENVVPMGNTLFYQEANAGNLILTKVAGKTCVQIEEAVRYKRSLPNGRNSHRRAPTGKRVA